jgi:hypothetical protein
MNDLEDKITHGPEWPEPIPALDSDQLLADLYEEVCEIRRLLQLSVVPSAESPVSVENPAYAGHPEPPPDVSWIEFEGPRRWFHRK